MIRIIAIFLLLISVDASAQKSNNIFIDSLDLNINFLEKVATYSREVVVKSEGNRLECEKMKMFFSSDNSQKYSENYSVTRILFFDNIILSNADKVINADRGEYIAEKRVIYFWDNVAVKEKGNYLEAEKIIYDLNKDLVTILNNKKSNNKDNNRVRIILDNEK